MSSIFTPANYPAIGIGAFVLFAVASFVILRIIFSWANKSISNSYFSTTLLFLQYTVYFSGLFYFGNFIASWSGISEMIGLDKLSTFHLLKVSGWRWLVSIAAVLFSGIIFYQFDGSLKVKSKNTLESDYLQTIYLGSLRKLLMACFGLGLISIFVWLFHEHSDLLSSFVGSDFSQSYIFSFLALILFIVAAGFIINQIFKILSSTSNETESNAYAQLKKPVLFFTVLMGAVALLPINETLELSNIAILNKSIFGLPIFWLTIYGIVAFYFIKIFNSFTALTENKLESWVNKLFNTDKVKENTKGIHAKIQNLIPELTHFIIIKKSLILYWALDALLIAIVPLGNLLPYALVLNLFFVIKLIIDGIYAIFIEDIQSVLAKKENIVLKLITKILPSIKKPIFFIVLCIAAMSILPNKVLVSKALIGLCAYLLIVIGLELIAWYAQQMTQKYLSENEEFANKEVDGFPVFTLMAKGVLILVIVLGVLSSFGFDVTIVVTGLGVAGFAIALALQSLLSDVFASMAISVDKPFIIGDKISVDNLAGTVEKIGIKTTILRTTEGEEVAVPNTKMTGFNVHNFTRISMRALSLEFFIDNHTAPEDLEAIPEKMQEIISKLEDVEFERASISRFDFNAIVFQLVVKSVDGSAKNQAKIKHLIYAGMHQHLHQSGIELIGTENQTNKIIKTNPAKPLKTIGLGRMYG